MEVLRFVETVLNEFDDDECVGGGGGECCLGGVWILNDKIQSFINDQHWFRM